MPKLKQTERDRKNLEFAALVDYRLKLTGQTRSDVAKAIGVTPKTISYWKSHPDALLKDVRRVFDALGFSPEEILRIL